MPYWQQLQKVVDYIRFIDPISLHDPFIHKFETFNEIPETTKKNLFIK